MGFFILFHILFIYVCVTVCMYTNVHVRTHGREKEGSGSPGTGVIGGCEPSDVGAGSHTLVPWM